MAFRPPMDDVEADQQFMDFLRAKFGEDFSAWIVTNGKRTDRHAVCLDDFDYSKPCGLCGGRIAPDVTDRPMCYGCAGAETIARLGVR